MGRLSAPGPLMGTNVVAAASERGGQRRRAHELARADGRRGGRHLVPRRARGTAGGAGPGVRAWPATAPGSSLRRDIKDRSRPAARRTGSWSPRPVRRGPVQLLVPADAPGRDGVPASQPGPGPAVRPPCDSTACACPDRAVVGLAGAGRPTVNRQTRDRGRAAVRGDGRRDRPGLRVHHRVGVRPVLLRPAARLLPGAQAPLRGHEAVARGLHGHGRRPRPTPPTQRSDDADELVSVAKSYIGATGHRHRPGLRADPRRHRGHLGPRPSPVPAAGRPGPGACSGPHGEHRRRGWPTSSGCERTSGRGNQISEDVESFRLRARAWLAGEHAAAAERRDNGRAGATGRGLAPGPRPAAPLSTAGSPASAFPTSTAGWD